MGIHESITVVISLLSLGLTALAMLSARAKASTERLEQIEAGLRAKIDAHETSLAALGAAAHMAITHDHLASVNGEIKAIAEQVHILLGQQQQMNENLRLMLANLVRPHQHP